MENMRIYDRVRSVPNEAKKTIGGGKLRGMTDINPMWRIKRLTEIYGPCGTGWYTELLEKHIEDGANGEKAAIVDIALYVKDGGEWSKPIYGTGGSMLVATQNGKLASSDEAYKMAYTDAISVCCKLLGFGADVYWDKDRTKYSQQETPPEKPVQDTKPGSRIPPEGDSPVVCEECGKRVPDYFDGQRLVKAAVIGESARERTGRCLCMVCSRKAESQ